ncbi:MAG: alpha/beta hydrolase [Promethearchaeota archaeon]|jgi:pimeloyl-ACP methyl ester carboxylesterase
MNSLNLTKKRIVLICIFLAIFTVGTIFIFITPFSVKSTYGLTTQTSDEVTISFNVFEPASGGLNKPAIIIGHGSMVNKEMVKGYALELAAAGFVAVPFDFRGHGQSTMVEPDIKTNDIIAIKEYLSTRGDVDMNSLGYIGYSMGGLGQGVIHDDLSFKCFIGIGTWLNSSLRLGNPTNQLNVLMIQALFDEAVELPLLKQSLAIRVGIPLSSVDSNKIYGSFQDGNASMIYLDDNSNHLTVAWDEDFIREARDWAINSFDLDVVDETYYVNIRGLILLMQVFGGIGFFFLIVEPLSKLILKAKSDRDKELKYFTVDTSDLSTKSISIKALLFPIALGIPGVIIFIPILLILPLAVAAFVVALLFGQAFGLMILLWRVGKKSNTSFRTMLKEPFKGRNTFIRQVILGFVLAIILYLIIYASIGLNYLGLSPSITKIWTIPIYFLICFFVILILNLLTQAILQNKFEDTIKNNLKVLFLGAIFPLLYYIVYLLLVALLTRSLFYFGTFIPISILMFTLTSGVSVFSYRKTGNIIVGVIINSLLLTFLIVTMSTPQTGFSFIAGMLFH